MRDAHIVCQSPSYRINDLGKMLHRGDQIVLTEEIANQSQDLRRAVQIRAVSLQWVERCRAVKPASNAPPYLRNIKKPLPAPPEPPQVQYVEVGQVKEAVAELLGEFKEDILGEIRQLLADLPRTTTVLPRTTPTPVGKDATTSESVAGDPSIFIPSNLVDRDAKATLSAKSEAAGATDVDKALSALRSVKK